MQLALVPVAEVFPAKGAGIDTDEHAQKHKTTHGQVACDERSSIFSRRSIKTVPVVSERQALLLLFSQPPVNEEKVSLWKI